MKEGPPNALEEYLDNYIVEKARQTSKLAANTLNPDDPIIDEAVFFDYLANEPNPEDSRDNDDPDFRHHGD